jgi:glycerophosphoryl diester phosphodiesterase
VCPENTLASFRRGVAEGADIIETDIRVTSDGEFVCIHDETVDRTTDGHGPVAGMTLGDLKRLGISFAAAGFEAERIPTLEEAAAVIPPPVLFAAELKSDELNDTRVCRRFVSCLKHADILDRTMVLSFSSARLETFSSIAPDVPTGILSTAGLVPSSQCRLLGPLWLLLVANPFYVTIAHRRGQMVCPLDPDPEPRLRLYLWLGCDAVLSNTPGRTRAALEKLGT